MFEQKRLIIEDQIVEFLVNKGIKAPFIEWKPIPFSGDWGVSTNFYKIASEINRTQTSDTTPSIGISQLAEELSAELVELLNLPTEYSRVEAVRGYLNLFYSTSEFSYHVITEVLEKGSEYGKSEKKNQRVMVEFSQPNTHKAFHVGHFRNMILGSSICNILEYAGYEVIRANYIGDIGLHVIQWLWNYLKYHNGEEPTQDVTRWMGDLYSEAVRRLEEDPELEGDVRSLFAKWDSGDEELVELWKKTKKWSVDGFNDLYSKFGVHFDRMYFDSEMNITGKEMVEDLIEKGLAIDERPDGPVIIKLDEILGEESENYRVLVILRSDGTALYATKDLPLAVKKFGDYELDKSIYVIDVRQSLYMRQIYKTLEIMGYPWADRCYHLAYEIVNLPGNVTMSSREGTVVLLEDLLRESIERARVVVEEKNPILTEEIKAVVAEQVALGGIRYSMLSRENTKVVTFDWESVLDVNGQAAPYIQYAHVRANSILMKVKEIPNKPVLRDQEFTKEEIQLVDYISRIPAEIQRSAEEYKPLHLTNLAYELARSFNDFYHNCPVLTAPKEIREFRLSLVAGARQAISNILEVLGIESPIVM